MLIYIDTSSGTWGPAKGVGFIDADEADIARLADSSDSEIIAFGKERQQG